MRIGQLKTQTELPQVTFLGVFVNKGWQKELRSGSNSSLN